jgi:hypothetical protein
MSEINYFKDFFTMQDDVKPVTFDRYKLVDDVVADYVSNLYVKRIILNN